MYNSLTKQTAYYIHASNYITEQTAYWIQLWFLQMQTQYTSKITHS